jgi:fumarate hydratase subunit alpha
MISGKRITEAVKGCLIRAGTTFRPDQKAAYEEAISKEKNETARWVLEQILENARVAEKNTTPLCDDTGIPHLHLELGQDCMLPSDWLFSVHQGVVEGLRAMPGRPMAVRGDDTERIEQSRGLHQDPGAMAVAPAIIKPGPGKDLRLTVLLLGGGPEIRAKTYRVYHRRSAEAVLGQAVDWIAQELRNLGCTPCVPAVGVGRSHQEASALMLEAMVEGDFRRPSLWEKTMTDQLNTTRVGPLAMGGGVSALASFIKVGPQRASGVRIVSARPCCCFEPRRATIKINSEGWKWG